MFSKDLILRQMESMRRPNGAFIASLAPDYGAMWIRDTLYTSLSYWYLGEYQKLREGIWVVFNLFKKHKDHLKTRIASPVDVPGKIIHAKYDANTLEKVTEDNLWSHHQLDAIGLFLHTAGDLHFKNIHIIRNKEDLEILQLLVWYLRSVEYWKNPDYGIWEECNIRHSSSIGAVVAGLKYLRKQRLAVVPDPLIQYGEDTLYKILPYESRDLCGHPHHSHDCDSAQLSLIWPFHIIVRNEEAKKILSRIIDGHQTEQGKTHRLFQKHGCNRYWGDDYYRSTEGEYLGISAEWPMFKFWISIIYSQFHENKRALHWFHEGSKEIVGEGIPEAYQNGKPNNHTPLAWAHAMALVAFAKLSSS